MTPQDLKDIHDRLHGARAALVKKMINDKKEGRSYQAEDRELLERFNDVMAAVKSKIPPKPDTWIEQVIKQITVGEL